VGLGPNAVLLFKHTAGTVRVTVYGPPIGWKWTKVNYFRFVLSTKDPKKWERRDPDREVDQPHLEKCVKAVRGFYKEREKWLAENYAPPTDTRA